MNTNIVERSRVILLNVGASPILYLMIGLSIVSLGIMIERTIFFFRSSEDLQRLAEQLAARLARGDVASSEVRDGVQTGKLTELDGDTDRQPVALHALVTVGDSGSVAASQALGITLGAFSAPGRHDVLSLATTDPRKGYEFWLIPSIGDNDSAPVELTGTLDPRLSAVSQDPDGTLRLVLASAAADLDGDGRDESIWLSPADDDSACALSWFDVDESRLSLVPRGLVVLTESCARPALSAVDADEDGNVDLVFITSDRSRAHATLSVLWNDGAGNFDTRRITQVSRAGQAPRAFTHLGASPVRAFTIVFVTEGTLEFAAREGRDFQVTSQLALERGTGVTAADFNGDGVPDLAVADAGKVRILKARLVTE